MTTEHNVPEGHTNPLVADGPKPEDLVSDEWRKRILNEKKTVQAERDSLKSQLAERDRKDLEARGEFQKIAEAEKARADAAEKRARDYEENEISRKKGISLLKALDNAVPQKYHHLLPIEKVLLDADGEVNATTLATLVSEFRRDFPEILIKKGGAMFPSEAPVGNSAGKISRAEWLKLDHKDMIKWKPDQIVQ